MKIDELKLSVRTYNRLKRAGIDTVEQLLTKSDAELMKIRYFGTGCLAEVHEKIRKPVGVTITTAVPGPEIADPNIMELCFHNGERHKKERILIKLKDFSAEILFEERITGEMKVVTFEQVIQILEDL